MDTNNNGDNRFDRIINYLANALSEAAGGVNQAIQSAGTVVEDKYSSVKLSFELTRLNEEQNKLFTNIGRTLFLNKNGAYPDGITDAEGLNVDADGMLDRLLQQAAGKQKEIDEMSARRAAAAGVKVCPACSRKNSKDTNFCPACGAKLPDNKPPEPPVGASGPEEK